MYEDNSEAIDKATQLVKACLLPELTDEDIGTKNFDLCLNEIEISLEVLFDYIRFNEINLFTANGNDTKEVCWSFLNNFFNNYNNICFLISVSILSCNFVV